MSLNPQRIGTTVPHGYAGAYARQPDMIVNTRPAGEAILFGLGLVYNESGQVVLPNAVIGGFEAAEDESNSVLLPNCEWAGAADANGIAEMRIKTLNRA